MTVDDEALEHLVEVAGGDARIALTGLEAAALAASAAGEAEITRDRAGGRRAEEGDRLRPPGRRALRRDPAFIKSIRGSDPDAALFWLARMLEAGEDPRFIARRMVVHAPARTSGSPTRERC